MLWLSTLISAPIIARRTPSRKIRRRSAANGAGGLNVRLNEPSRFNQVLTSRLTVDLVRPVSLASSALD